MYILVQLGDQAAVEKLKEVRTSARRKQSVMKHIEEEDCNPSMY